MSMDVQNALMSKNRTNVRSHQVLPATHKPKQNIAILYYLYAIYYKIVDQSLTDGFNDYVYLI